MTHRQRIQFEIVTEGLGEMKLSKIKQMARDAAAALGLCLKEFSKGWGDRRRRDTWITIAKDLVAQVVEAKDLGSHFFSKRIMTMAGSGNRVSKGGAGSVLSAQSEQEALKKQVQLLAEKAEELEAENKKLKEFNVTGDSFDEVGFWLLDRNFDRSTFEDFGIDAEATEVESKAKSEHKRLAKQYHPDKGGTAEQMANANRLRDQMIALVKMNGGMGL